MNELVALDELKKFLGIPLDDHTEDNKLTMFKNSVEQTIKNFCETDFDLKEVNEILDGLSSDVIVTKNVPIREVKEIFFGVDTDGTGGVQLANDDFYYDENLIYLRRQHSPLGRAFVRVRYVYGYDRIPADVTLAVMQSVKAELQRNNRNSEDVSSRSKQGESESFGSAWDPTTGLPKQIMSKLEHYRRIEFPMVGYAQRNI